MKRVKSAALVIGGAATSILQTKSGRKTTISAARVSIVCRADVVDAESRKLKVFSLRSNGPWVWTAALAMIVTKSGVGSATKPRVSKISKQLCGKFSMAVQSSSAKSVRGVVRQLGCGLVLTSAAGYGSHMRSFQK